VPLRERRRDAAWEYRQQLRRQGMSPGEADQAALRRFPDITLDELNPGHGRSTLDKIGGGLKKVFNAISPIDIGGPDLPSTVPPPGSVPMGQSSRRDDMPVRFDFTRSSQPGFAGSGPFNPMGGPGLPGFMPPSAPGALPPGIGVSPLTMTPGGVTDPTAPGGIGGQATPGAATAGGGGLSTLEKAALISSILGAGANIFGAFKQGQAADEERARIRRREAEQRRAREALLPAYMDLLGTE